MDEKRLEVLVKNLDGITSLEWARFKKHIDMRFSWMISENILALDKEVNLLTELKREFNLPK